MVEIRFQAFEYFLGFGGGVIIRPRYQKPTKNKGFFHIRFQKSSQSRVIVIYRNTEESIRSKKTKFVEHYMRPTRTCILEYIKLQKRN